jgi:hypothetical protein
MYCHRAALGMLHQSDHCRTGAALGMPQQPPGRADRRRDWQREPARNPVTFDRRAPGINRFVFPEVECLGDPFLSVVLGSLTIAHYINWIWHGDPGAVVEQAAAVEFGKNGIS